MKKRTSKLLQVILLTLIIGMMSATGAMAAKAGWNTISGKTYYYVKSGTKLKKVTGLYKINGGYYYFDKSSGVMQKGWVNTSTGYRYFRPTGAVGTAGRMYVGFHKINGHYYYFRNSGVPIVGFWKLKYHTYYFNPAKTLGSRGQSMANKWVIYKGDHYYFGADQFMTTNKWVGNYYLGADGKLVKDTVTPDGYKVDAKGKRVSTKKVNGWVYVGGKYHYYSLSQKKFLKNTFVTSGGKTFYLNADGVRVTGWKTIGTNTYYFKYKGVSPIGVMAVGKTTIDGLDYYFNSKGVLQKNVTVDGYTTDPDGVIKRTGGKPKILIVAGHGQGDVGAASTYGSNPKLEYLYTRDFAKRIVAQLQAAGTVEVEYYKNGSTNYNLYERQRTLLSSYLSKFTGSGAYWKTNGTSLKGIYTANSALPNLWEYDYILEVHFNAKVEKTTTKDNNMYGCGFYVNSYKKSTKVEEAIITAFRKLGLPTWGRGTGMFRSADLLNARICTDMGTEYGLLETCFIDDPDDMAFYTANRDKMAKAAANVICSYF